MILMIINTSRPDFTDFTGIKIHEYIYETITQKSGSSGYKD